MANETEHGKTANGLLRGLRLSDTIILAAVPAVAYMVTYFYRLGYLGYFQIPIELVAFSPSDVIVTMGVLAMLAVIVFVLGILLFTVLRVFWPKVPGALRWRLAVPLLFLLMNAVFVILSPTWLAFWLVWLIFILAIMVVEFLPPLWAPTDGSYLDKLEFQDQRARLTDREHITPVDVAFRLMGPKATLGLAVPLALALTAFLVGQAQAVVQRSFYVTNTSPEAAVVLVAQDYVVCVPFERSSRETLPAFLVLRTGESPGLVMTLEKIGPLHPRPPSKSTTSAPVLSPTPLPNQP